MDAFGRMPWQRLLMATNAHDTDAHGSTLPVLQQSYGTFTDRCSNRLRDKHGDRRDPRSISPDFSRTSAVSNEHSGTMEA